MPEDFNDAWIKQKPLIVLKGPWSESQIALLLDLWPLAFKSLTLHTVMCQTLPVDRTKEELRRPDQQISASLAEL